MAKEQLVSETATRTCQNGLDEQEVTHLKTSQHERRPTKENPTRPRRRVRINIDNDDFMFIEQRIDLSPEDIAATWYSKNEYQEIRDDVEATVKLLRAGLTDPERVGSCYRGLEYKIREVRRSRNKTLYRAFDAVLKSQQRFGHREDTDQIIARNYLECTGMSRAEAHRVGLNDERNVEASWRQDETPRAPSRRRSQFARAG